jgi:hypothetical protein
VSLKKSTTQVLSLRTALAAAGNLSNYREEKP